MGDDATLVAAALDDRYVIERQLGAGGMAVDYRADAWLSKVTVH